MTVQTPTAEDVRVQFAQLAVQYYVAGRSAAIHQLIPVLGNLLHHAVEMSLKAALASSHSMSQLKAIGHNLPNLWKGFASAYPAAASSTFQATIDGLHKFEELRYPDSIMANGAMMEFALLRAHAGIPNPGHTGLPRYSLILEDVDELVEAVFLAMNFNPSFLTGALNPRGKAYLFENNLYSSKW
jgi:hypothetical protein